ARAATALLLARAGHDVLLLDRATLPRDTTSTHALARGGVVQLHRWACSIAPSRRVSPRSGRWGSTAATPQARARCGAALRPGRRRSPDGTSEARPRRRPRPGGRRSWC